MSKTVVVYGSSTGTCEAIAEKIGAKIGAEVVNVQDLNDDVLAADNILLGTSTWGAGELQDDWYDGLDVIKGADLSGKTVVPFLTSGGSELGEGQGRIETLAKGAAVRTGKRFRPRAGESDLKAWISGLNLE